jgi:hypothetical protein
MVRFGTYLEHHAVPEWASQYLDYAALARTLGPVYFSWKGRKQRSDTQPVHIIKHLSLCLWSPYLTFVFYSGRTSCYCGRD